eukprot:3666323-Rhodomonas_salina.1
MTHITITITITIIIIITVIIITVITTRSSSSSHGHHHHHHLEPSNVTSCSPKTASRSSPTRALRRRRGRMLSAFSRRQSRSRGKEEGRSALSTRAPSCES